MTPRDSYLRPLPILIAATVPALLVGTLGATLLRVRPEVPPAIWPSADANSPSRSLSVKPVVRPGSASIHLGRRLDVALVAIRAERAEPAFGDALGFRA